MITRSSAALYFYPHDIELLAFDTVQCVILQDNSPFMTYTIIAALCFTEQIVCIRWLWWPNCRVSLGTGHAQVALFDKTPLQPLCNAGTNSAGWWSMGMTYLSPTKQGDSLRMALESYAAVHNGKTSHVCVCAHSRPGPLYEARVTLKTHVS